MLISFSGAQSTGKTTLLKHLQERNDRIWFVPEVTRLVKRKYNLPINESGGDITQTMIMGEHMINAFSDTGPTILDRCSLDGIVYTHWLCDKRNVGMQTYSYAQTVFGHTMNKYDVIFYTSPDDVPVEDDGERSTDVAFRNEIIQLFNKYMSLVDSSKIVVLKGTVEERLKQIKKVLSDKGLDISI